MKRKIINGINAMLDPLGVKLTRFGNQIGGKGAFSDQAALFNVLGIDCRTIFDVGAYRGTVALNYRRLFPDASIYSFEPVPDSYEYLKHNLSGKPGMLHENLCVSGSCGQEKMYINDLKATNSILPRPDEGKRYYPKGGATVAEVVVPSVTLDSYLLEKNLLEVDILKLDVQGAEIEVLRGAKEALSAGRVKLIYTEVMYIAHYKNSPLMNQIWDFLADYGYTIYNTYNNISASDGQLRQGDAMFLSPSLRDALDEYSV